MDSMLSKALRAFIRGPFNQLIVNLGGSDGTRWEEELKKFLRKEPCWVDAHSRAPCPFGLSSLTNAVVIPMAPKKSMQPRVFSVDTSATARIKISHINHDFRCWFTNSVPEQNGEFILRHATLCRGMVDTAIIAELGDNSVAEVTLADIFSLLERQKNAEPGVLLTNGRANIFYVRDGMGTLCSVSCAVRANGGWSIGAYRIDDSNGWNAGAQVFCQNLG